ncbi:hypothetical protein L3X38_004619 [Prunus dulcis]|uniref:Uncharacterized protein n=1 Tax=Prunus dulcis TaxID=3755 RepID=A0AAD4ZP86_PRUDU|nr:hypothetical protein L3X38_004619 [Prunus dulcis]
MIIARRFGVFQLPKNCSTHPPTVAELGGASAVLQGWVIILECSPCRSELDDMLGFQFDYRLIDDRISRIRRYPGTRAPSDPQEGPSKGQASSDTQ